MEKKESMTNSESLMIVEWTNQYLEEAKIRFSKKTFDEKKSAFARFIRFDNLVPEFPVELVTVDICRKFLNHQFKNRSGYAANKDRKNLGTAWNWGKENINRFPNTLNPFLEIKKYSEERSIRYVPPESDFWKVYNVAKGQDQIMLLTYYYLAARRNEIFLLKWTDVDFNSNQVRLWTQKRKGNDRESDWLPMTPDLKHALLTHREMMDSYSFTDNEYVFVCLDKTHFCEDYYGKPFKVRQHFMERLCEKAKVKKFGFHSIRHLVATTLYHNGRKLSEIQAILRHKSPSTTERYLRSLGIKGLRNALEEGLSSPTNFAPIRQALEDGLGKTAKVIPFPNKKFHVQS
jgi:integrase